MLYEGVGMLNQNTHIRQERESNVRPNHIWYHYHLPVIVVIIVTNDDRLMAGIIFHRELLSLDLFQEFMYSVVILN